MKTTEQLVRECFCPNKLLDKNDRFVRELWKLPRSNKDVLYLARAARRFVKAEQMEKSKRKHRLRGLLKENEVYCSDGKVKRLPVIAGKCKIVVEKGGYNLQAALKRAEERERKRNEND